MRLYLLTAFVTFASFVRASPPAGIDCSLVPPPLLCGNPDLAKECGTAEICNRYEKATEGKKLQFTILYASWCGCCTKFITETLVSIHSNWTDFVEIELVKCGWAKKDKQGKLVCGFDENKDPTQLCVIHSLSDPVDMIVCIEGNLKNNLTSEQVRRKCFDDVRVSKQDQDKVEQCIKDDTLTAQLHQKAAERTINIWPEPLSGIPHFLYNNVSLSYGKYVAENAIESQFCDWFGKKRKDKYCRNF